MLVRNVAFRDAGLPRADVGHAADTDRDDLVSLRLAVAARVGVGVPGPPCQREAVGWGRQRGDVDCASVVARHPVAPTVLRCRDESDAVREASRRSSA